MALQPAVLLPGAETQKRAEFSAVQSRTFAFCKPNAENFLQGFPARNNLYSFSELTDWVEHHMDRKAESVDRLGILIL